jgi:hypothetical protein
MIHPQGDTSLPFLLYDWTLFKEGDMATRVRRTREQRIADLKAELAKLEATPTLTVDNSEIKKLCDTVERVCGANGWAVKDVVKLLGDKLAPKVKRKPRVKTVKLPA